jgi:TIR domain
MASTPRIFVSHSHADNEWCAQLVDALTRVGFDVWFDKQGLYVGDQWVNKLEAEIESREVFLIVLTPDSWSSRWVRREYELALHRNKRILGVKHKPVELTGFITTLQILDAVGQDAQSVVQQISTTLGVVVRTAPTALAVPLVPASGGSPYGPRIDGVYVAPIRLGPHTLRESYYHVLRFYPGARGESATIPSQGQPLKDLTSLFQMWPGLARASYEVGFSSHLFEFIVGSTPSGYQERPARYEGNATPERGALEISVRAFGDAVIELRRYTFVPVTFADAG